MYLKYGDKVKNFNGNLKFYRAKFPALIDKYFPLSYKEKFTLSQNIKYYRTFKNSGELSLMEQRILKILEKLTETRENFNLESIFYLTLYKKKYNIILAVESLIDKKLIVRYKSK